MTLVRYSLVTMTRCGQIKAEENESLWKKKMKGRSLWKSVVMWEFEKTMDLSWFTLEFIVNYYVGPDLTTCEKKLRVKEKYKNQLAIIYTR